MALSNITPLSGSTVEAGEIFLFTNDDTVSTVSTIQIIDMSGTPASSNIFVTPVYQVGWTGSTSVSGTNTTFQFSKDAGIGFSPFQIKVTLADLTVFTLNYSLRSEVAFPTHMQPLNDAEGESGVEVQDEGIIVLGATPKLNFAGLGVTVTDDPSGTAKITVAGGSETIIFQHFIGIITSTVPGFHFAQLPADPYHGAATSQHFGNAVDPVFVIHNTFPQMPFSVTLTDVEVWFRPTDAAVGGVLRMYKITYSSGTTTVTATRLGTDITIPPGGGPTMRYDVSTSFTSSNSISKGEGLCWTIEPGAGETGTLHLDINCALKKS